MATEIPAAFAGFDELEGFDPVDKAQFVGEPLGITAVRFRLNDRGVLFAEAEVVCARGEFAINDSSTGVRDQLIAYLSSKGKPVDTTAIEPGEASPWVAIKLYASRGLRVSEYDVHADGQTKKAKTYYITTSGRHADPDHAKPAGLVGAETQAPGTQASKTARGSAKAAA